MTLILSNRSKYCATLLRISKVANLPQTRTRTCIAFHSALGLFYVVVQSAEHQLSCVLAFNKTMRVSRSNIIASRYRISTIFTATRLADRPFDYMRIIL
jgi:hypothetical protein